MSTVRVGLIGCGKVGQIHAKALLSLPEAEFVAVCDANAERAASFADQHGVRGFTDLPAMLREAQVEAVIIGTPHPLHAGPAIAAAEAGVHVLVEKPLAANLADCDAMLAAARKANVRLGVISQRRFYESENPDEWPFLHGGEVGKSFRVYRCRCDLMDTAGFRLAPEIDQGWHCAGHPQL